MSTIPTELIALRSGRLALRDTRRQANQSADQR